MYALSNIIFLHTVFEEAIGNPVFVKIGELAQSQGFRCFLIGGFIRDLIMGNPVKDADIVVDGDGILLAEMAATALQTSAPLVIFKNFGTAMIQVGGFEIEFVSARRESYSPSSRKPEVTRGTIEDDQFRRDFTINAMAICLNPDSFGEFSDPFNGIQDINDKIIRTPLNPEITFSDDPLRMLRAIRFSAKLGFSIHTETYQSLITQNQRITIVSAERIAEELNKMLMCDFPSSAFKLLFDTGILHIIFPELAAMQGTESIQGLSHKDNFYHTLKVVDQICPNTKNLWLRWAALLHDIAKPATKRFSLEEGFTFHGHEDKGARMVKHIFRRLKLPMNEKMQYVQKMVALHLRPKALAESEQTTDSGYRRLIIEAADDLDDLFTLCHADITSANAKKVSQYRENLERVRQTCREVEERDELRNWQPPVDGLQIMDFFGIAPGHQVGIIKNFIREGILEGEIPNSYEGAWQAMIKKGEELGLKPKLSH